MTSPMADPMTSPVADKALGLSAWEAHLDEGCQWAEVAGKWICQQHRQLGQRVTTPRGRWR